MLAFYVVVAVVSIITIIIIIVTIYTGVAARAAFLINQLLAFHVSVLLCR